MWRVRLAKTRAEAARLLASGRVRINGRKGLKASAPVRAGDVLTLAAGGRVGVFRVAGFPRQRIPAREAEKYRIALEEGGAP